MERKQMTFYVSFWDAINALPKKDQLPVIRATIAYGLFGSHEEALTISQKAFFSLIKPTLDASRKKAAIGKHGGSKPKANGKQTASKAEANCKQTASKAEANCKQTASEGEGEKENEIEVENEVEVEVENENECYIFSSSATAEEKNIYPAAAGIDFDSFWNAYPNQVDWVNAHIAWRNLIDSGEDPAKILDGLERWKISVQWEKEAGRYIPSPANWLEKKRYLEKPVERQNLGATGHLGQAERESIARMMNS